MSTNKSAANRQTSNDPTHPVSDQLAESLHSTVDALHNTAAKTEEQLRSKSDASGQAIQVQKRLLEKNGMPQGSNNTQQKTP
ncbi:MULTISPECIES: hypothetical protein [unclassified Pseudoalteromonas]|uniref:hypothetical protein n=1 Tax=unclassified Pseudoalteromonas TaxID=194690 RepID=UPI0020978C6E|nr:hypothetical protein [Pseudoalteromonas sp. XMcav2-N]MCO7190676.1 hypothetical protein [Pseudoalteromonas sp. XMcav2-N]